VFLQGLMASVFVLLLAASIGSAADFTLSWDANCNDYPGLIGYNLYYLEGASVLENPDDSIMIYIPLSQEGFDPESPSYTVTGLKDNVEYYFTISAVDKDEESGMSNEVSGISRDSDSSTIDSETSNSDDAFFNNDLFRTGCFISEVKNSVCAEE
jgi:hypothetical protein